MAKGVFVAVFLGALLALAAADVYLQSPRGMNDRCDEESNDRNNEQRLFNSNNNAAGGYAWADTELSYYENTNVRVEYTAQHSCGNGATNKDDPSNPESTICQQIIQLGCDPTFKLFAWGPYPKETAAYTISHGQSLGRKCTDSYSMTSGCTNNPTTTQDALNTFGDTCTETRPLLSKTCPNGFTNNAACNTDLSNNGNKGTFNSATCQCSTRKAVTYAVHEPENWYLRGVARQRNKGLFTADQQPNANQGSENTRQEPNSARYGYEITEERDYYPYFYPSPWVDLAVMTTQTENCTYYQQQSQNVADKCECSAPPTSAAWAQCNQAQNTKCPIYHITQADCQSAGFTWTCYGSWNWAAPDCSLAAGSNDNRLGNMNLQGDTPDTAATESSFAYYDWTIPTGAVSKLYSAASANAVKVGLAASATNPASGSSTGTDSVRCALRLRYNISTAETLWSFNNLDNGRISNDPVKVYGIPVASGAADDTSQTTPVRLAVDTAQYGRTFQDRTYVFNIKQRSALPSTVSANAVIHNLNVRGKRGNIAQVRNCVEYDFVPNKLNVNVGDVIHFQWTGSDYNDQGNAGEGRDGTDRTNVVAFTGNDYRRNYPNKVANMTNSIFSQKDLLSLAWIGQNPSQCYTTSQSTGSKADSDQDLQSCHFLNGARMPGKAYMPTATYAQFVTVTNAGTLNYMGTRNNNFSNRSQKGTITATAGVVSNGALAGIVVGSVVGVAVLVVAVLVIGSVLGFFSLRGFGKYSSRV